jgi:ABC-type branched-subunit amino acid transport system permease subunit
MSAAVWIWAIMGGLVTIVELAAIVYWIRREWRRGPAAGVVALPRRWSTPDEPPARESSD